ncbi:NifB/NifX family molybdenum-iron cluster-binding protein [Methanococcus sp. CF]
MDYRNLKEKDVLENKNQSDNLKIAVPVFENKICEHFGKTALFLIFEIDENYEVVNISRVQNTPCDGNGGGSPVENLLLENPDIIIYNTMGEKRIETLKDKVKLYQTTTQEIKLALKEFIDENLINNK